MCSRVLQDHLHADSATTNLLPPPLCRHCAATLPAMDVRVLFFARSRELAGTSEATLALEAGSTTAALLPRLMEQVRTPRWDAGAAAAAVRNGLHTTGCWPHRQRQPQLLWAWPSLMWTPVDPGLPAPLPTPLPTHPPLVVPLAG